LSAAKPLHDAGKIRILGVIERDRYPTLPQIPTIAETLPGFELPSWLALVAPAGTPQSVIDKENEAGAKILKSPSVTEKLASYGLVVIASSPAQLSESIKSGLEVRGRLIKASGIQPE
jgi:tripartite-type tricarboxylate transporter receptor subunit TctC